MEGCDYDIEAAHKRPRHAKAAVGDEEGDAANNDMAEGTCAGRSIRQNRRPSNKAVEAGLASNSRGIRMSRGDAVVLMTAGTITM